MALAATLGLGQPRPKSQALLPNYIPVCHDMSRQMNDCSPVRVMQHKVMYLQVDPALGPAALGLGRHDNGTEKSWKGFIVAGLPRSLDLIFTEMNEHLCTTCIGILHISVIVHLRVVEK